MNQNTHNRLEARASIIKAMAHPSRLFIVEELAKGPRCVCEITGLVGADISTVSKHLSILKNAGIVDDQKRGTQVWYSLRCPCVLGFLSCVESVMKSNAKRSADLARK
jgi:ArsR family transcriptional regulator, arsenate/arsenite/antimonite-responsive transcriptional repressor